MDLWSIARVSSSGQDVEGQVPANQRWADANGHNVTRLVELKASAYKPSKLTKLIEEVQGAKPDGIILRRADRLSRQGIEHGLTMVSRLRQARVKVFLSDMGIDITQADKLTLAALFHVAWQESKTKGDRTLDNHAVIASRGAWMGLPAYGYEVHNSKTLNAYLAVCEEEAGIARELFRRCAEGASLRELTAWLNHTAKTRRGKQWDTSTVRKMLRHKPYATGSTALTSTPKDEDGNPIESRRLEWDHEHPVIVSRELFDAAQASLSSRRNRDCYARDDTLEALEGAIVCSRCGGRLYLATQHKNGHAYVRYQCRMGHGMRKDKAEAYVAGLMTGHLMVAGVDVAPKTPRQETELEALRKELARTNAATAEGRARITELWARIDELGDQPDEAEPETVVWVDVSLYETGTWAERRELCRKAGIRI